MKKAKIMKAWAALGDAKPSYAEYERRMNAPASTSPYGYVSALEILGWILREEDLWMYYKLKHAFSAKRVAQLKAAERRPKYYAAENERRRALAAERRKIRVRRTVNACPTREAILEAWAHRKDSHAAAIRFGSMLEDLECYLDNSLRRDENGVIIGRNPGIKGWLFENAFEISEQYTTAMRYKAAAKKLKQIVELADPTPADAVLQDGGREARDDVGKEDVGQDVKRDYGADEIAGAGRKVEGRGKTACREAVGGGNEVPDIAVVRARAIWLEMTDGIGTSVAALFARIDALTDPERVEEANMLSAWREKYCSEITVRTKKKWWRRLAEHCRCG